jgi:hypothetical protein
MADAGDPRDESKSIAKLASGMRFDLIIAVCALLISSFAAAASWWQARIVLTQTEVLQSQLGAQVWPYVSFSEGINNDTVRITLTNDGLGPAVLRNASATVDGVARHSFVEVMHAILGPHVAARAPHGEKISLSLNDAAPGAVLRAGETLTVFGLSSKRFAAPFAAAADRLSFHLCYCAIIPGRCWVYSSEVARDPAPTQACPEVPGDLLHSNSMEALTKRDF